MSIKDIDNPCREIRMQNSQLVFFKRKNGWVVINILENSQTTTLKGFPLVLRTANCNRGVISSREHYYPRTVLGIYEKDGGVFVDRLLVHKSYQLLSPDEVGWEVKDFSLLNGTLTWLKYKLEDNETVTDLKVC
jgi:hypothetical protein